MFRICKQKLNHYQTKKSLSLLLLTELKINNYKKQMIHCSREFEENPQSKRRTICKQTSTQFLPIWCRSVFLFLIIFQKFLQKWISKHFRMLKGATPLLQRDRPLIFMLATKNVLSSTFLSFFYDIIYMFMISIHSINHLNLFIFI